MPGNSSEVNVHNECVTKGTSTYGLTVDLFMYLGPRFTPKGLGMQPGATFGAQGHLLSQKLQVLWAVLKP
jgi:hypothetical protein